MIWFYFELNFFYFFLSDHWTSTRKSFRKSQNTNTKWRSLSLAITHLTEKIDSISRLMLTWFPLAGLQTFFFLLKGHGSCWVNILVELNKNAVGHAKNKKTQNSKKDELIKKTFCHLKNKNMYTLPLGSETKDLICTWQLKSSFFFCLFFFSWESNVYALCPNTVRLWSDMSEFCWANVQWLTVICSPA